MGLKTNKATKTSRLDCQYVGSFSVKDGDKKLSVSEQNKFVDEKLKNCTKKLLDGMPVSLQVSPDGIQVLASDEKTVKMAHTLRRVSYATVEPVNKLFAYVSHQPGTDMEVVCHTFVTKKKDHAEGLSAALGKLFKQTFAYTLKRRDKLEEAAQKRGANRRWAKHQAAEGHSPAVRNERNARVRSADVNEQRKENGVAARAVAQQRPNQTITPSSATIEHPDIRPRRRAPPGVPNASTFPKVERPLSSTSATGTVAQQKPVESTSPASTTTEDVNVRQRRRTPPGIPNSPDLNSPLSYTSATVHPPPTQPRQTPPVSPTVLSEWNTPFFPPSGSINSIHPASKFDNNNSFSPSRPLSSTSVTGTVAQQKPVEITTPASTTTEDANVRQRRRTPPGIPNSPALNSPFSYTSATVYPPPTQPRQTPPVSPTVLSEWNTLPPSGSINPIHPASKFDNNNSFSPPRPTVGEVQLPDLPSRSRPPSNVTEPSQANLPPELPSRNPARRSSTPSSPQDHIPPLLPRRYSSDSQIGFIALGPSNVLPSATRQDSGIESSAPFSPIHPPVRLSRSSDSSVENSPTHRPVSKNLQDAAAVLLADADVIPPPLPRKGRQAGNQPPSETETIPEEVIGPEEDEELRRGVRDGPRISLTLEDEDWYIPGVPREIVTEMLETSDIGTFLVRDSQSRPGCYALTMKVVPTGNNPTGFGNYLIVPQGDGFSLQGFEKIFPDISTLIRHYSSHDDGLPCRLLLAGSNPLFHDSNGYLVEFMDEEDDKYSSLSDCTSMFREINMNSPW